jgi:hypothetical protein
LKKADGTPLENTDFFTLANNVVMFLFDSGKGLLKKCYRCNGKSLF